MHRTSERGNGHGRDHRGAGQGTAREDRRGNDGLQEGSSRN